MSEIIARAITPVGPLQQFLDALTPIVQEAKLHFDDDGIHARAVDPANVAMSFPDLDAAAFESYESPGEAVVGANLESIDDRIDIANSGDLVELALDMETRMLEIDIRNVHQELALIDQESIRDEPDIPDLDLPNEMVVEGGDWAEAIDVIGMATDHVVYEADPEAEHIQVIGEGDTDESVVTFGHEEVIDAKVPEATRAMFSHEYLDDLADPIPKTAEVAVELGDEFPVRYEYASEGGHLEVMHMVAPRIQNH
jgi:proliferating cell nuclear antigen